MGQFYGKLNFKNHFRFEFLLEGRGVGLALKYYVKDNWN